MSALRYWVWLSSLEDVSVRAKASLIRRFGDAESVFFSPPGALADTEGVSAAEAAALARRELSRADAILADCERQHLSLITLQDALYPARLKQIAHPPAVLYVRGRFRAIDDEAAIAVVGTRKASPYGLKMGRELACGLCRGGALVISGLTSGVDAAAAAGALQAGGVCLGVLGTAHEQQESELADELAVRGALISEYPPGTPMRKSHFRDRNRISAGLSVGVVAVEAPEKSGTLLFVAEALEQGKEIFAVPGNADVAGCRGTNRLLKEGAKPVTEAWDVLCEFAPRFPEKLHEPGVLPHPAAPAGTAEASAALPAEEDRSRRMAPKKEIDKPEGGEYIDLRSQLASLSEVQLKIVGAIGREPTHIDDIVESTALGAATVLTQLTVLTVKGFVKRVPGNRVVLNVQRRAF